MRGSTSQLLLGGRLFSLFTRLLLEELLAVLPGCWPLLVVDGGPLSLGRLGFLRSSIESLRGRLILILDKFESL